MPNLSVYWFLVTAVAAYLAGSVPFGLLIGRAFGLGDIRKIGSGNTGATNVLRTGRKDLAVLTLVCDALKGIAVVALARAFASNSFGLMATAGLFAVAGHCFPVWLGFKGGKGVATGMGVAFALSLWLGLTAAVVWLVTAALFRMSSLSGLTAMTLVGLSGFMMLPLSGAVPVALYCVLIIAKHHQNIQRLLRGTEPKIGAGK